MISPHQLNFWNDKSYIILPKFFSEHDMLQIKKLISILRESNEQSMVLKYYETGEDGERILWRLSNFIAADPQLKKYFVNDMVMGLITELAGEDVDIFKDKIHFKFPGSGGFLPHQDGPAYQEFGRSFITLMLAVDDIDVENGCLYLDDAWGKHHQFLPQNEDGSINTDLCDSIDWKPVICQEGDVVIFDSYIPHYSEPNHSDRSRRSIFITFGLKSEGCDYTKYSQELKRKIKTNRPFQYGFLNKKINSK